MTQLPHGATDDEMALAAPPSYSEHVLDQLYTDIEPSGLQTPVTQSGVSSPLYGHSRAGSSDNLAATVNMPITPAALSSRLQSMSLDPSHRNSSYNSMSGAASSSAGRSGFATPHHPHETAPSTAPPSAPLSRQNSGDRSSESGSANPLDIPISDLNRVPSYQTAVRAPARPLSNPSGFSLPDYRTATSTGGSAFAQDSTVEPPAAAVGETYSQRSADLSGQNSPTNRRRQFLLLPPWSGHGDADERRRMPLHLLQARERAA